MKAEKTNKKNTSVLASSGMSRVTDIIFIMSVNGIDIFYNQAYAAQ